MEASKQSSGRVQPRKVPEHRRQQVPLSFSGPVAFEVRRALLDWLSGLDVPKLVDDPELIRDSAALKKRLISDLEGEEQEPNGAALRKPGSIKARFLFHHIMSLHDVLLLEIFRKWTTPEGELVAWGEPLLGLDIDSDRIQILQWSLEGSRRNIRELEDQYMEIEKLGSPAVSNHRSLQTAYLQLQYEQTSGQVTEEAAEEANHLESLVTVDLERRCEHFFSDLRDGVRFVDRVAQYLTSEELPNWQRAQRLAENGQPIEINFEWLQHCCEMICGHIGLSFRLLEKFKHHVDHLPVGFAHTFGERISNLERHLRIQLHALVRGTFIVEEQPAQVIVPGRRFTAKVRFLIGERLNELFAGQPADPPRVVVTLAREARSGSALRTDCHRFTPIPGELRNNAWKLEHHRPSRRYSAPFRNLSVKGTADLHEQSFWRFEDQKFCLLFDTEIEIAGMTFRVQARSLPIVVITEGDEESRAWATIVWDNAFSVPKRVPFAVCQTARWDMVAQILSKKFRSSTGRGLCVGDVDFMATRIFHRSSLPPNHGALDVSWSLFCEKPLSERDFSFWAWFFAVMKLTSEHLRALWMNGLIHGFIGLPKMGEMLLKKPNGTFMLSFSQSLPGGVQIVSVQEPKSGQRKILVSSPLIAKDLQIRNLRDRVSDSGNLLYLYPGTPKDGAFGKYPTTLEERENQEPLGSGRLRSMTRTEQGGKTDSIPSARLPICKPPGSNIGDAIPESSSENPSSQRQLPRPETRGVKRRHADSSSTPQQQHRPSQTGA